ncbi:hypothetical protein R6Q59_036352 [Mikania micrantha]
MNTTTQSHHLITYPRNLHLRILPPPLQTLGRRSLDNTGEFRLQGSVAWLCADYSVEIDGHRQVMFGGS